MSCCPVLDCAELTLLYIVARQELLWVGADSISFYSVAKGVKRVLSLFPIQGR